ncbi:MAG TPA: hypothetical protein VGF61_17160 [Candidatus Acidoferrum sp.]
MKFGLAAAALCLIGAQFPVRAQQVDDDLMARRRVFKPIGPGLRAVRRGPDGKFYVLTSPGSTVSVFDDKGALLKKIPDYGQSAGPASADLRAIQFAEDMDVAANGTVYVADRGAGEIKLWDQTGSARAFRVAAPLSIAALPDGEVAVAAQNNARLITVYGANGKVAREIGSPEELSTRADLNRYLSMGRLASDPQGRIYYGYTYLPEPLVRQYDRFGFSAGVDFEFTGLDAMSEARAMRREIDRQDKREDKRQEPPHFLPILTAFGVDPETGEVWMCLHNTLLHFDKEGNRRSEYQIFTPDGSRLDGVTLLVEEEVLLIGSDPLGVYEFQRPDKKH